MLKDMLVLVLDHFFCSSITRKGLFESVDQNHKSYVQELLHHPVTHPGGQLDKIKQYLIRRAAGAGKKMTMMPSLDLLMRLRKEWVQVINKNDDSIIF